jgi:hypothetical protein
LHINEPKGQVIEFKSVIFTALPSSKKARGENMKVSLAMLLKTHVEKMSVLCLLAMLMIKNELKSLSGDVDEKKVGYLARFRVGSGSI